MVEEQHRDLRQRNTYIVYHAVGQSNLAHVNPEISDTAALQVEYNSEGAIEVCSKCIRKVEEIHTCTYFSKVRML